MAIFVVPTTGVKPKNAFAELFPSSNFEKIWEYAHSLMAEGEHIEHLFKQNRWCLKLFPAILLLSNRRAIFINRGLLSTTSTDFYWRMFKDIQKEERWSGSVLRFTTLNNTYHMSNLPQNEARSAYAFAQSIEEMAFEFRRWQRLEEERAAARGVALPADHVLQSTIHSEYAPQNAPFPPQIVQGPPNDRVHQAIRDLKKWRAEGVMDEQEYQKRLHILINQL